MIISLSFPLSLPPLSLPPLSLPPSLQQMHVTAGAVASTLSGCVQSAPPPQDGGYDPMMYALDCEMCYTTAGPELTRITVIDWKLNTVYDTIVKPDHPIVDYNTR